MIKARHKNGKLYLGITNGGCVGCIFVDEEVNFCHGFLQIDNTGIFNCGDENVIFIEEISEEKGLKKKLTQLVKYLI